MKILFIHDDCQTMGGANTYRKGLCRALKSLGHEAYLFTMEPNAEEKELCYYMMFREKNLVVDHFKRRYFYPSLFFALGRVIEEIKPDIIHIHNNNLFPNSVLLTCDGIPVVQTLHDWKMICPTWNGVTVDGTICERGFSAACYREGCISRWRYHSQCVWRKLNTFLVKRQVNVLITPSMALNRALRNYGLESIYIPNYADTSRYLPSPLSPDGKRILCACHLYSSKGVDHLLMAFQNVLVKIPSARLDIVGDGPERENLEKLCISLKIQNSTRFWGVVPHAALADFYSKANVIVLPSVVAENCPLVVLEAMASGRPVIGSRIGGIPEIVLENETGLIFNPGNIDELTERIVELLLDPERSERMGRLGRKRVEEEFSAEKHVKKILDLYHRLTKGSRL